MGPLTQSYSPQEFMKKLRGDGFRRPIVFTGMIKETEDDTYLLFANGANCNNWITIHFDLIDNIELLEVIPCKNHTHPLVNLSLKEPASEEAKLFAALARSIPMKDPRAEEAKSLGVSALSQQFPGLPSRKFASESQRGLTNVAIGRNVFLNKQAARAGSCSACWQFCNGLTQSPNFDDFLWCLNFCGPICPD